jgi:hypothetical protein
VAKRKRSKNATSKSAPRKIKRTFWGDKLLSLFYFIQGAVLITGLAVYASLGFGFEFAKPLKDDLLKQATDPQVAKLVNSVDRVQGIGLTIIIVGLVPLVFFLVRGLWRGNRFAFLFVFLENAISVTIMLMSTANEARYGAILPILILIFSLLRLFGAIGPKMR